MLTMPTVILKKGLARSLGGFMRSFVNGDREGMKERWQVLQKKQKDPYDTFELQLALQKSMILR